MKDFEQCSTSTSSLHNLTFGQFYVARKLIINGGANRPTCLLFDTVVCFDTYGMVEILSYTCRYQYYQKYNVGRHTGNPCHMGVRLIWTYIHTHGYFHGQL